MITRDTFLKLFIIYAEENNIAWVMARPKASFINPGEESDIDMIVDKNNNHKIISWIKSLPEILITSFYKRFDGQSICAYGVKTGEANALGIDFINELSVNGLNFCTINAALQRKILDDETGLYFLHPVDQSLVLLMIHGIKHSGSIKESYSAYIQQTFAHFETAFTRSLVDLFGEEVGIDIQDKFKSGEKINKHTAKKWFSRYRMQYFSNHGLWFFIKLSIYYITDLVYRFKNKPKIIAFYGVDGAGKTTLIKAVKKNLFYVTKKITQHHVVPTFPGNKEADSNKILSNPHEKKNRGSFSSLAKLIYYTVQYWIFYLWPRRVSEIALFDRFYYDIIVDPIRYRYGASLDYAWMISKILPRTAAVILVDIDAIIAQKRKQEVSFHETSRQTESYRSMIKRLPNNFTVNGALEIEKSSLLVTHYIVNELAKDMSNV